MNYRFHSEADQELLEAVQFYESREPGLGGRFLDGVESTIDSILENPEQFGVLDGDIRVAQLRRFPYGILYSIESNEILIVAVMHLHRRPGYWIHRAR